MRKLIALLYCLRDLASRPLHRCRLTNWHQLEAWADGYARWTCVECGRTHRCRATWVAARLAVIPSLDARATVALERIERATKDEAELRREAAREGLRSACRGRRVA